MTTIEELFLDLTGYPSPRQFQKETIETIRQRNNALLRAPTGSGKTETAIAPFLFAQEFNIPFPKKLIYIVPLRTLANSLRERTNHLIAAWNKKHPSSRPLVVTLQTGENPEDPRFEGDIVFCTIDQMLSSFLNIPYSVGRGSANVNAGAIFASYLVFDELHLLDPDRSFATLLQVLKQVNGISPFLLMTATLTDELVKEIQGVVKDIKILKVPSSDLTLLEEKRQRTFKTIDTPLSAELILDDIKTHNRKRVIVLCNTVSHSQGLFQDLEALDPEGNLEITLLHSRFLAEDRKKKESTLEADFGKDYQDDGKCHVLISTQVIEVGINITCEVMHSHLSSMNSLLQRAGRCARFGGAGEVRIYREVSLGSFKEDDREDLAEDVDEKGEPTGKKRQFLPYDDSLCNLAWDILKSHDPLLAVGFETEFQWINTVHKAESELQIKTRQNNKREFLNRFEDAIFRGDYSASRDLIRWVNNRNIYVSPQPLYIDGESNEVAIDELEPFSLPLTTLCKALGDFKKAGHQTWLFKSIQSPPKEKGENYSQPICLDINSQRELATSLRILVNPNYIFYDEQIGLRIIVNPEEDDQPFSSQKREKKSVINQYKYHMDTYKDHLCLMWERWLNTFKSTQDGQAVASVREEMRDAGGRFIKHKIFTQASMEDTAALFEILVFFAIFTHDLGKLQSKWQKVMRGWQEIAYRDFQKQNPANHLLAHTDYDPNHPEMSVAYKAYEKQNKRPSHAIESAFLSYEILESHLCPILEDCFKADDEVIEKIVDVVIMASGRHHSAWTNGWEATDIVRIKQIDLHKETNQVIARSWKGLSKTLQQSLPHNIQLPSEPVQLSQTSYPAEKIRLNCFDPDDLEYQQFYALIARALRVCDMRSVQINY